MSTKQCLFLKKYIVAWLLCVSVALSFDTFVIVYAYVECVALCLCALLHVSVTVRCVLCAMLHYCAIKFLVSYASHLVTLVRSPVYFLAFCFSFFLNAFEQLFLVLMSDKKPSFSTLFQNILISLLQSRSYLMKN